MSVRAACAGRRVGRSTFRLAIDHQVFLAREADQREAGPLRGLDREEVGADTAASSDTPAMAVFCTISKLARLVTAMKPADASTPLDASAPISLSRALWRPTSSRKHITSPSAVHQAAACTAPVACCSVCKAWNCDMARAIARRSSRAASA